VDLVAAARDGLVVVLAGVGLCLVLAGRRHRQRLAELQPFVRILAQSIVRVLRVLGVLREPRSLGVSGGRGRRGRVLQDVVVVVVRLAGLLLLLLLLLLVRDVQDVVPHVALADAISQEGGPEHGEDVVGADRANGLPVDRPPVRQRVRRGDAHLLVGSVGGVCGNEVGQLGPTRR